VAGGCRAGCGACRSQLLCLPKAGSGRESAARPGDGTSTRRRWRSQINRRSRARKTYATAAERAKAAYPLFRQTADQYGWLTAGQTARYFAGATELELGQQSAAEADLEKATHAGSDREALAKIALANLYAQTGRNSQAVTLFQDVIAHPTTTVPKAAAQLQLAQLYETTQPAEARRALR
jgi:tetratricopeptide (TPR) repeat protein